MHTNNVNITESLARVTLSIIVPTYNESGNIIKLIERIERNIPDTVLAEIIVIDDNSPDGTGMIIEDYAKNKDSIIIIHRERKKGLISAIMQGIEASTGENILVMDADLSHPPELIPSMLQALDSDYDLVIASRYINGGSVVGWPMKRRLLSSSASKIAIHGLNIQVKDPLSGFFLFKRHIIKNIQFNTNGYKILLEILVKAKNIRVKEIPYTFINRNYGKSKLDSSVILDYIKAIWHLYRYGRKVNTERRRSVLFLSKAARFYTVGLSGLLVNYIVSFLLSLFTNLSYINATAIGIVCSITSNFILNKAWTFEDRDFSARHALKQYALYSIISSVGAALQLSLLYLFVQYYDIGYTLSLILAVGVASIGNFLFNKKWTFKEKIWS